MHDALRRSHKVKNNLIISIYFLQQHGLTNVNIQQQQQQFQVGSMLRFSQNSAVRPANVEQYEELLQRQQSSGADQFQNRTDQLNQCRLALNQQQLQRPQSAVEQKMAAGSGGPVENAPNEQEIPDNVTAELEKLEEESGTMAELQGVSDILGGLGDEDDDILGEQFCCDMSENDYI